MAAFSFQHLLHHPFLFDSILFPGTPDNTNTTPLNFSHSHFPSDNNNQIMNNISLGGGDETSSCVDQSSVKIASLSDNEASVTKKQISPGSSYVVEKSSTEKKRRARNASSPSSAQSKVKKQKKAEEEKKAKPEKKKEQVKAVEPPTGYIHVRARRGQATDSHSLAERVRREKISERMKMLQRLVPGCDEVTGRAVMLDEIINYVQSLQNQIEFLSMKLSSVNPMFYEFGPDYGDLMVKQEVSPFSTGPQCSPTQPTSYADTPTTTATTTFTSVTNSYPVLDSVQLHQQSAADQLSRSIVFNQNNESLLWDDAEDQRQSFLNPSGFNNLCSFN